jgi:FKBP-type peptidyl-prolyl cis-trans isomerase
MLIIRRLQQLILNIYYMKLQYLFLLLIAAGLMVSCGGTKEVTTKSGFKVLFHTKTDGKKPEAREWVYFKYSVTVRDSLLDYTREGQPVQRIQMPDQISNAEPSYYVLEAFEQVSVGDSISLYVPVNIIPGPKPEFFTENDTLVYGFTITAIKTEAEYEADLEIEQKEFEEKQKLAMEKFETVKAELDLFVKEYKAGTMDSKLTDGPGGVKIYYYSQGEGDNVKAGQSVDAHYVGSLTDGTIFDASYQRGNTINFTIGAGQVIPGWDEGFQQLKKGSKAILVIPPDMGYGEQGQGMIPPNSTLIFHVDVDNVK